jgi:hypothetical protein
VSTQSPAIVNPAAVDPATLVADKVDPLIFPQSAIVGSIGEFAKIMSEGTEVSEEFYFATGLTMLGASCGNRLKLDNALNMDPRLYLLLLGASGLVKKSTAVRKTADFFESVWSHNPLKKWPILCHGLGSAEGLAVKLQQGKEGVVLIYDEIKALIDKSKIESSTLLSMIASLFELTRYENATKKKPLIVEDARLSLIGCCTTDTYENMWTADAIAIGLPNRLFIVGADSKKKVCWPEPRDKAKVEAIRLRIIKQMNRLPLTLGIEPEAKLEWEQWYESLPSSIHARRLDTIGLRLLGLIALTTDKNSVDLETVQTVVTILDYELNIRMVSDPIDADKGVARMEMSIRRQLHSRGPLTPRKLRQYTNADKTGGIWMFNTAITNLTNVQDISKDRTTGEFQLTAAARADMKA